MMKRKEEETKKKPRRSQQKDNKKKPRSQEEEAKRKEKGKEADPDGEVDALATDVHALLEERSLVNEGKRSGEMPLMQLAFLQHSSSAPQLAIRLSSSAPSPTGLLGGFSSLLSPRHFALSSRSRFLCTISPRGKKTSLIPPGTWQHGRRTQDGSRARLTGSWARHRAWREWTCVWGVFFGYLQSALVLIVEGVLAVPQHKRRLSYAALAQQHHLERERRHARKTCFRRRAATTLPKGLSAFLRSDLGSTKKRERKKSARKPGWRMAAPRSSLQTTLTPPASSCWRSPTPSPKTLSLALSDRENMKKKKEKEEKRNEERRKETERGREEREERQRI
jgi:hypothetical protein